MRTTHRSRSPRRTAAAALAVATAVGAAGVVTAGAAAAAPPPGCTQAARTVTCEFAYTGAEQTLVVPDGVTSMTATLAGAAGGARPNRGGPGATAGGPGAVVTGTLTTTPGSTLYIEVGQAGAQGGLPTFNGGGSSTVCRAIDNGASGGGASDIRTASGGADTSATALDSRLVVAGAGGGGGTAFGTNPTGGPAGGDGEPSAASQFRAQGGRAGSPTSGGAGGAGATADSRDDGAPGAPGRGGAGGGRDGAFCGGGGGGGLYGGGGGGGASILPGDGGGGGGGSSLVPAGFTLQGATNTGNGTVTLSWTVAPAAGAIVATSGGGQSAQAGAAFAQPLVATVTDPLDDAPIPGAAVTFTVTAGSATFPNGTGTATATTGPDGRASTPLTAGTTAGPVTVTATTPGAATPATFTGTVTAPPPVADRADLTASLAVPATLRAGSSGPVTLTVRNTGPGAANRVASGIALPNGLTVTGGGGGAVSKDKRAVGFLTPTIAANGTVTYTVTVTADRNASGSKPVGGGVLSTATRDPNLGNNYQIKPVSITR